MLSKLKKAFKRPRYLAKYLYTHLLPTRLFSDRSYLKKMFYFNMGRKPELDDPKTFNEKLQWLKLNDRKDEYTMMVDKYRVREYVAATIGEEYLIPLLGVWDDPDEIDFDRLPDRFVLKCNHNSGRGLYICRDKSRLDRKKAKKNLKKGLKENFYYAGREWPYKNVSRKVIAEQYMTDTPDSDFLTDYKFFCFHGKADCVMLCLDRASGDTKFYFFDRAWNLCRYNLRGKAAPEGFTVPKPAVMDRMFEIAERLSHGLTFARIDLYCSDGKIYFGEITFFPDSGFDKNLLPETDLAFGEKIKLDAVRRNKT